MPGIRTSTLHRWVQVYPAIEGEECERCQSTCSPFVSRDTRPLRPRWPFLLGRTTRRPKGILRVCIYSTADRILRSKERLYMKSTPRPTVVVFVTESLNGSWRFVAFFLSIQARSSSVDIFLSRSQGEGARLRTRQQQQDQQTSEAVAGTDRQTNRQGARWTQ